MKERAVQLVRAAPPSRKRSVLREYLQAHILFSMQSARAFEPLSFVGGTALRFLYGLRRFSEDLDFSLESPERYDLRRMLARVQSDLQAAGFEIEIRLRLTPPVQMASIRVLGILHEFGLSPHRSAKLTIRLEIDTHPPAGANTETTLVNRHFLLALQHHDLPSLMAGKIHALLNRSFTKGRDVYDLVWYLTRSEPVRPNIPFLRNALAQTGWVGPEIGEGNWRCVVEEKLQTADLARVLADVEPLLETPEERAVLTAETIRAALRKAAR